VNSTALVKCYVCVTKPSSVPSAAGSINISGRTKESKESVRRNALDTDRRQQTRWKDRHDHRWQTKSDDSTRRMDRQNRQTINQQHNVIKSYASRHTQFS